jgi:condensation domain-containing protein
MAAKGVEGLSPAKRALLEQALRRRREAAGAAGAIPRRTDTGPAPLSFSQQRIWFLDQWEPGAPTFNGARAIRLRGALDVAALQRALEGVVERHESLRTVIAVREGEPVQIVLDSWSLELPVVDVAATAAAERDEELRRVLRERSRMPFDLSADLMLAPTLIRLGEQEHVLLLRMHHVAADAFSDAILFRELGVLYDGFSEGRAAALPELPITYSDFAAWQRERLSGPLLDELVSYWTRQLEGAPPLLALPTDRPRLPVQRHEGTHHRFALSQEVAEGVTELCRSEGVTVFMTLLAAFSTFLYRITGEDDVVLGSPIANRNNAEVTGLIGFFSNTLALRTRLSGSPSFREVVARARETATGAFAHQELPFERVVQELRVERDPGYNPLFQVNFRAHADARAQLQLAGLETEPIAVDIGFSRFDLALELQLAADGLSGFFEFDQDLFDPATIAGFVEDFAAVLEQAIAEPDAPILALSLPNGARAYARQAAGTPRATSIRRRRSAGADTKGRN